MNTQKIILTILGLGVILGLGFFAIKSNNKITEQGNEQPIEIPEIPAEVVPIKPVKIPTKPVEIPTKPVINPIKAAEFNKVVTLYLNNQTTFSDGLKITLKEIHDSNCPKDVECFWAGELAVVLLLSSGRLMTPETIDLGVNKSVVLKGYTFSLLDATATSATVVVN